MEDVSFSCMAEEFFFESLGEGFFQVIIMFESGGEDAVDVFVAPCEKEA